MVPFLRHTRTIAFLAGLSVFTVGCTAKSDTHGATGGETSTETAAKLDTDSPADIRAYGDAIRVEIVDFSGDWGLSETTLISTSASALNRTFLRAVRDRALEAFPQGSWINVGPDSSCRSIRIVCKEGEIEVCSWHPLYEDNPNVVAASYGLTTLDGLTRDAFLEEDDQDYVAKRNAFDEIDRQVRERFAERVVTAAP